MAPTTMSPAPALPSTGDDALARFRELLRLWFFSDDTLGF